MTFTAKLNMDFFFSRADCKSVAAGTDYFCLGKILRMSLLFHINLLRDDADLSLQFVCRFVFDGSIRQREQRMVFADADIYPGVYAGTALPYENRAGFHFLSGVSFDTEPLCLAIAAVLAFASAFFMCHCLPPLSQVPALQSY